VPSVTQFYIDLNMLLNVLADGPSKSFCFRRLSLLDSKFMCVHNAAATAASGARDADRGADGGIGRRVGSVARSWLGCTHS